MKEFNLIALIICLFGMLVNRKDMKSLVFQGFLAIVNAILFVGL